MKPLFAVIILLFILGMGCSKQELIDRYSLTQKGREMFDMVTLLKDYDGSEILHVADVNGDGHLDIVQTSWNRGEAGWHINDGNAGFVYEIIGRKLKSARNIMAIQLDGSGYLEILVCAFHSDEFISYSNRNGRWIENVISERLCPASCDVGDINQDGLPDIVLVSHGRSQGTGGYLDWFENKEGQSWKEHNLDTIWELGSVKLYDYDKDGDLDIFASANKGRMLVYWENLGKGSFSQRKIIDSGKMVGHIIVTDLNNNGCPDLIAGYYPDKEEAGRLVWWEYINDSWKKTIISNSYSDCYWIDTVDLNEDGLIDLVTVSAGNHDVSYWENVGNKFIRHVLVQGLTTPRSVGHGDFNGNGLVDLAVTSYGDDMTFMLLNKGFRFSYSPR